MDTPVKSQVPVLLHQSKMGDNWTVFMCVAPGGRGYVEIVVHATKLKNIKIDPKTQEVDLPAESVYQMKHPPQEFFCPMFCVIGLYEDK